MHRMHYHAGLHLTDPLRKPHLLYAKQLSRAAALKVKKVLLLRHYYTVLNTANRTKDKCWLSE